MWFLGLGSSAQLTWFLPFLDRLLEADPATLRLLRHDPFDGERPVWVRARVFRYRYSTWEELRRERVCWVRREIGLLIAPRGRCEWARQARWAVGVGGVGRVGDAASSVAPRV